MDEQLTERIAQHAANAREVMTKRGYRVEANEELFRHLMRYPEEDLAQRARDEKPMNRADLEMLVERIELNGENPKDVLTPEALARLSGPRSEDSSAD